MSIYWKEKKKKRSNIKAKKTKKPSRTSPKCPDPCTRSPNHHSRRLLQLVLKLASMLNLLQADEFIIFRFLWRVEAGKWVDSNLVVSGLLPALQEVGGSLWRSLSSLRILFEAMKRCARGKKETENHSRTQWGGVGLVKNDLICLNGSRCGCRGMGLYGYVYKGDEKGIFVGANANGSLLG